MSKILVILLFILYQTQLQSKETTFIEFNQRYLSNYFSALFYSNNQDSQKALKHFNLSKDLIFKHDNFFLNYIFSLVENNQVNKALVEIEKYSKKKSLKNFEINLLKVTREISNKNFVNTDKQIEILRNIALKDTFEIIIVDTLESYIKLFINKKIIEKRNDYGKLSIVTRAFHECYLQNNKSEQYFLNLINYSEGDYSRYLYFFFLNLINKKEFTKLETFSKEIDILNSNLLILQSKNWIDNEEFEKFSMHFSCDKENHLISEFFYLIANLYSSQGQYKLSNFYLNISQYLNPSFYFNISLLSENYLSTKNYKKALKTLNSLGKNELIYNWYRVKKTAQIFSIQKNQEYALSYLNKNLIKFSSSNIKINFDLGNIYKNFKQYEKSIEYYNKVLNYLNVDSFSYSDVLYRRGSSYERLKNYTKSDKDLINSLKINPDDPFVMNYLAYSWLERNYNVDIAIEMLKEAYGKEKNNPYITDSLGWAYYIIGNYKLAEKYLNQAVQLKPNDSVIMDHYGDSLWMLGRKQQAKYFWKNVLKHEDTDELNIEAIKNKLILGVEN